MMARFAIGLLLSLTVGGYLAHRISERSFLMALVFAAVWSALVTVAVVA